MVAKTHVRVIRGAVFTLSIQVLKCRAGLYPELLAMVKKTTKLKCIISCSHFILGKGCAREKLPGIYAKVSYYLDWIRKNWVITNKPSTKLTTIRLQTQNKDMLLNFSTKFEIKYQAYYLLLLCLIVFY